MWAEALDCLFQKMPRDLLGRCRAVSVSGQQHGTVWWATTQELSHLNPALPLCAQLKNSFSLLESPIWMDTSTNVQCRELETAMGGADALCRATGSRAYERFSGPQIMRIRSERPQVYSATERISLVSSFIPSLLAGRVAPIDASDASGMNLLDITTGQWHMKCLSAVDPEETLIISGRMA
ncbi:putative Xylulose kinase [Paratrimastix pyriformis]|uniref:Xylulose kinase n=1 Tax=Paratrimastix pyriformis TaxID=342808 RepID=A0ABQ8UFF7_9EUKA|nr:putative Xylulose kinase [Paratrimastix pyriformis]